MNWGFDSEGLCNLQLVYYRQLSTWKCRSVPLEGASSYIIGFPGRAVRSCILGEVLETANLNKLLVLSLYKNI